MGLVKNTIYSFLDDTNALGIGALIIFIAIILVAGIAASVILQTVGNVEQRAAITGEQTTSDVATGIRVTDIEGEYTNRSMRYNISRDVQSPDGDENDGWHNYSRIQNLTLSITPQAGSTDIDLTHTYIEISNSTVKCVLTYDSSQYASSVDTGGIFSCNVFDLGPTSFGLIVIEDSDSSCDVNIPIINEGDRIMLSINASHCFWGLPERTDVWGRILIEEGAFGEFAFRTPSTYKDVIYDLF